jgi:23S rRNA (guanosine2251-2'-O)-methyltransferase
MPEIVVVAHNIRSTHNVGSIFRTCEGFGVKKIILSGYTPYPHVKNDTRLPHISEKIAQQIHKTALGAEALVPFIHHNTLDLMCPELVGYTVVALEQSPHSVNLRDYIAPEKVALLLGEEVHGITPDLLARCHSAIEIPMQGQKESFNVSVAAGIALYALSTSQLAT